MARAEAKRIFGGIDVHIEWRESAYCRHDAHAIRLTVVPAGDPGEHPGALAYALLYEGVHIVVYYDRVETAAGLDTGKVMAYVFVHEITHILQCISRHSSEGIMKAHWERADYDRMMKGLLEFTPEDLEWIHRGLEHRAQDCGVK